MLGFMKFQLPPRLAKTTAAVLIAGMLVCGAVLIWAPQETVAALIGLAGLALGAVLRGLTHGEHLSPEEVQLELHRSGERTIPEMVDERHD